MDITDFFSDKITGTANSIMLLPIFINEENVFENFRQRLVKIKNVFLLI